MPLLLSLREKMDKAHCRHRSIASHPSILLIQQGQISGAGKALKPLSSMEVTNRDSQLFTMGTDPENTGSNQC